MPRFTMTAKDWIAFTVIVCYTLLVALGYQPMFPAFIALIVGYYFGERKSGYGKHD